MHICIVTAPRTSNLSLELSTTVKTHTHTHWKLLCLRSNVYNSWQHINDKYIPRLACKHAREKLQPERLKWKHLYCANKTSCKTDVCLHTSKRIHVALLPGLWDTICQSSCFCRVGRRLLNDCLQAKRSFIKNMHDIFDAQLCWTGSMSTAEAFVLFFFFFLSLLLEIIHSTPRQPHRDVKNPVPV